MSREGFVVSELSQGHRIGGKGYAFLKLPPFAIEQNRADVVRRRERWLRASRHLDPARLVFIDETWIKTNMAPVRGWGPRNERLTGFAPDGR